MLAKVHAVCSVFARVWHRRWGNGRAICPILGLGKVAIARKKPVKSACAAMLFICHVLGPLHRILGFGFAAFWQRISQVADFLNDLGANRHHSSKAS